jgi:uncharacterized membrane protein YcaP (DUF421 family)
MFFDGWNSIINTLIIGVFAYIAIVFFLRVSGKRTLSKWNAFDFIVTVALGSSLATALLSKQTTLFQGITGFMVLILMQFIATWLAVRSRRIRHLIKSKPALLFHDGNYLDENLKKERVTKSEIRAAIREKGISDMENVFMVILETDGTFSIINEAPKTSNTTLVDISG